MKLIPQNKLNKSLEKPILKYRPLRSEIDLFKTELINVLDHIDNSETEEFHKNLVSNFLSKAFYTNTHFINTKGRQDLVIHTGKDNKHSVGVIIEAKRPTNKADWFTPDRPNSKALQELVLYYLRERIEEKNIDIKYLIATNINEWYIIESSYFKKLFYDNKKLVKDYEDWRDGKKDGKDTGVFYNDIAKPFIDSLTDEIPCIYFNIREHEKALRNNEDYSSKELNALFKILSPYHLLKVPFANDNNELDEKFYKELLHIIGLEEAKEGGKNIIRRKKENRNLASLLEKVIDELKTEGLHKVTDLKNFGDNGEEQYFNIALELCITWINRILFLKLLEGQLINYHKSQQYRFLNSTTINDFDELFKLFHKVLAVDVPDRTATIQQKYSHIPYLNSSLFEISELEDVTIKINAIDSNDTLEYISSTILKEDKKKNTKLNTIEYLFQFLDAYDFASEGTGDIQEDNKTLINASVLGKVFEKINGYKDGSIYTPGFITMYMSRQSIRLAVVQKFNEANGWACKDFADLDNFIEYQQPEARNKANALINDLKLCDPAVGSGHFLVSALNEIIAIKSELKILQDVNGKRLKEYCIDVVNDELIITDEDNDLFIYNPQSPQSQLIQQTLFNEKQIIIENCLFGVDINPNSVKICRLRLWIELLKNAYYKQDGNLETLPNIDINIKCGNSLLSRFALYADLSKALKSIKYDVNAYRGFVNDYKNCKDRELKRGLQLIIDRIKADFRTEISKNDPLQIKLNKASNELYTLLTQVKLFDDEAKIKRDKQIREKLEADITKWAAEIEDVKNNAIYKNAFEWRFEFPEVLNNNGDFEGFDVVIGNPPYGVKIEASNMGILKTNLANWKSNILNDSYFGFIPLGLSIGKSKIQLSYIIPNTWRLIGSAKDFRNEMFKTGGLYKIDTYLKPVFEEAVVDCDIIFLDKNIENQNVELNVNSKDIFIKSNLIPTRILLAQGSINSHLGLKEYSLLEKIKIDCENLNRIVSLKNGAKPYEVGKGNPKQTRQILDDKPFTKKIKIDNTFVPLIGGSNFHKYLIKWDNDNFISYGPWLAAPRDKSIFEIKEKIIVRQTSDKLIATIISDGFIMRDNTHILLPDNPNYELKYILALINSRLIDFVYWTINPERGEALAQVKVSHLDQLPIKYISREDQKPFIDLVDRILIAKQNGQETITLEHQIDTLVYRLYDLTPDEIAIVENSGIVKNKEPESQLQDIENE